VSNEGSSTGDTGRQSKYTKEGFKHEAVVIVVGQSGEEWLLLQNLKKVS